MIDMPISLEIEIYWLNNLDKSILMYWYKSKVHLAFIQDLG